MGQRHENFCFLFFHESYSPILFMKKTQSRKSRGTVPLKVHKIENFFGFDIEFCVISLIVMLKY